jgi:hypothetical protein
MKSVQLLLLPLRQEVGVVLLVLVPVRAIVGGVLLVRVQVLVRRLEVTKIYDDYDPVCR